MNLLSEEFFTAVERMLDDDIVKLNHPREGVESIRRYLLIELSDLEKVELLPGLLEEIVQHLRPGFCRFEGNADKYWTWMHQGPGLRTNDMFNSRGMLINRMKAFGYESPHPEHLPDLHTTGRELMEEIRSYPWWEDEESEMTDEELRRHIEYYEYLKTMERQAHATATLMLETVRLYKRNHPRPPLPSEKND